MHYVVGIAAVLACIAFAVLGFTAGYALGWSDGRSTWREAARTGSRG